MATKTVYAIANGIRLGAMLEDGSTQVMVWRVTGKVIGMYNLDRFHNSNLTKATLTELFTQKGENNGDETRR